MSLRVALLGCGVVGTEVARLLTTQADDLAARPLSQRLVANYVSEIEKLAVLVSTLGIRDSDAQRRTDELMEATLRQAMAM